MWVCRWGLGYRITTIPISLLLVDEREVTTSLGARESANLHRRIPLVQAPVDVREVAPEPVQNGPEDDVLLEHPHHGIVAQLEQVNHLQMRVDLFEQLDELKRRVVRPSNDGFSDGVTKCHYRQHANGRILDAAKPTIDKVGHALVEGALFEAVTGQGLGNARRCALAYALDVADQIGRAHV